ncbi:DNA primase [Rhodoferax sp. AJA081-3]|uniref:DNA primase n=1 Tax=Rhodoferax sp. AJA081-3 TaxID=2752316 RepID=UPI001AE085ED|nr:DNA primase [Rhodoferax sp. AJA081-3]QTN29466.1 DNA primase [Rhodoferax sp. AJA081-3]
MAIPQTFIQELIARADVVEIVGRYVQLKKGGANFMGLCPFHGEKSPSFSVSPAKQFYHCFGCGKNGNAISFLMDHAGMTFIEAVKDLAQQYGMQIPEDEASPEDRARAQEQKQKQNTLTDVLEKAGDAYRRALKDSPRAIAYFKGRGLSGEIAKQFGLGYAPEGWRSLASVFPHYDDPLLVESGLVISNTEEGGNEEKRYDRFRDRVMFPIRNIKGECIGFGGRVLGDDKPKYLNSPETPVFSKGRELYGLFEARNALREHGYVLVTEGYMDVVALAQLGFPNAVATLGTACTADHVHKLFRFTDAVVFSFDGDSAGKRAARKALDAALPYATDVRSIKFLFLPDEHDPDSFIRAHGQDEFARYVSEATPLSRFLVEAAREGCDLNTAEGRAHMAANAKPLWGLLPDGALKLQLLSELAAQVQLPSAELGALWAGASQTPQSHRAPPAVRHSGDWQPDDYDENSVGATSWGHPLDGEGATSTWKSKSKWEGKSEWKGKGKWEGKNKWDRDRPVRPPLRGPLASRADHATRILLGHSELWEALTNEDHALLCELPAPHGPLIAWLEAQLHEHGPLAWGALRDELKGQTAEELALRLMSDPTMSNGVAGEGAGDTGLELRDLLNRMLIDRIKEQETLAIAAISTDPTAQAHYRELHARRLQLELASRPPAAAT